MSDPRRALLAERESLVCRLARLDDPGAVAAGDEGDLSVHADRREFALGDRARLRERVRGIDRAIARVDAGDYGRCVDCGEAIKPARLRAIPEAETCIPCQGQRELLEEPAQDRVTRSRIPIGSEDA